MTIGRKTRGTGGRCAILGSHGQTVRVGMSGTSKHFQIFFFSHAVDEVEDFKSVQRKPQLDSDTEADGMWLLSNLHATV